MAIVLLRPRRPQLGRRLLQVAGLPAPDQPRSHAARSRGPPARRGSPPPGRSIRLARSGRDLRRRAPRPKRVAVLPAAAVADHAVDGIIAFGEPEQVALKIWFGLIACVGVLALQGCGGGSSSSSGEPNLRRCQATCSALCARQLTCSPCNVDDCQNLCLGTTDGLTPACAE